MVIAGHMWNAGEARYGWHATWGGFLDGARGVFIFFVISGYLITKLLLREYDRRGTYSLGRFYYRRFFRIVPPLYLYIFFVVVTVPLSGLHVQPVEVLTASTFTRNLVFPTHRFLAGPFGYGHFVFEHFWSLCIEEQFYLCWPLMLLFVLRRSGRSGATRLAVILILAAPIYRLATYPLIHDLEVRHFADGLLLGHMDALMFGCIAALAEGLTALESAYLIARRFAWLAPIWFFGISAALTVAFGNRYQLSIGDTLDGVAVLTMMLWAIRNSASLMGRVLNWRPVVHIGVISYSIYIWQTYFLHHDNPTIFGRFPWNLICILGAAELSWQTIERLSRFARDWGERCWAGRARSGMTVDDSLARPRAVPVSIGINDGDRL